MEEHKGEEEEGQRQRRTRGAERVGNLVPGQGRAEAGAPCCPLLICSFPTPFTYVPRVLGWPGIGGKFEPQWCMPREMIPP